MPSHYGKERSEAAASRAKAMARALRRKKRGQKIKELDTFLQALPKPWRSPTQFYEGEAPELKAHGVKPSK